MHRITGGKPLPPDFSLPEAPASPPGALLARVAPEAGPAILEFFAAEISNNHTRRSYLRAASAFFAWCHRHQLRLHQVLPVHVAAYREVLLRTNAPATIKARFSALRALFDFLVAKGVLPTNPASAVRSPRLHRGSTRTPAMLVSEARDLLDHLANTPGLQAARDRALIAVMLYTFARVAAVCRITVADYDDHRRRRHLSGTTHHRPTLEETTAFLTVFEKGSKPRRLPLHSHAAEILDRWLDLSQLRETPDQPIFQGLTPNRQDLRGTPLTERQALRIVKARASAIGLSDHLGAHSCRATGITGFLATGGSLEQAAYMAGHERLDTTKGYDHRSEVLALEQLERLRF